MPSFHLKPRKMKIITWNINGLRSPPLPPKQLLDSLDADIICLQETKITRDMMDSSIALVDGYSAFFSYSRKRSGYSGVATYCRHAVDPVAAEEGISGYLNSQNKSTQHDHVGHYGSLGEVPVKEQQEIDAEGRAVITEHRFRKSDGEESSVCVINVYCPRADKEREDRKAYKLRFCQMLQTRAEALLAAGKHVIIVGDLNISHRPIDTCDSSGPDYGTHPCRIWFDKFLFDAKRIVAKVELLPAGNSVIDSFRYFRPEVKEAFTCWSTATGARKLNYGARIDYVLGDKDLVHNYFRDCSILPAVLGFDHCPVMAEIDLAIIPADKCPALCTKYMPEFTGKQKKMVDFFKKRPAEEKAAEVKSAQDVEVIDLEMPAPKRLCLSLSQTGLPKTELTKKPKSAQMSLKSYFQQKSPSPLLPVPLEPVGQPVVRPNGDGDSTNANVKEFQVAVPPKSVESSDSADQWRKLLRGPEPPPLCSGHKEPAILKKVNKAGPNRGRSFYMCARPEGYKTDQNARCKFFKWIK